MPKSRLHGTDCRRLRRLAPTVVPQYGKSTGTHLATAASEGQRVEGALRLDGDRPIALVAGHSHDRDTGAGGTVRVGGGEGHGVYPPVAISRPLGPQEHLVRRGTELGIGGEVALAQATRRLVVGHTRDRQGGRGPVGVGGPTEAHGAQAAVRGPQRRGVAVTPEQSGAWLAESWKEKA